MLNEWKEFQAYTGAVNYTARNKQDTTYLGRFTFDTILDFEGLNRVLTILARGFLFHNEDGSPAEAPKRPGSASTMPSGACVLGAVCRTTKTPRPGRRGSLAVILENSMGSFPALRIKTAAGGSIDMCIGWWILCGKIPNGYPAAPRKSVLPLRKALTGPGGTR